MPRPTTRRTADPKTGAGHALRPARPVPGPLAAGIAAFTSASLACGLAEATAIRGYARMADQVVNSGIEVFLLADPAMAGASNGGVFGFVALLLLLACARRSRRRGRLPALALLTAVSTAFCGGDEPTKPDETPPENPQPPTPPRPKAVTDEAGAYRFANVDAGRYALVFAKDGYYQERRGDIVVEATDVGMSPVTLHPKRVGIVPGATSSS